jgi:geranylgeranyl pyrophosphate synthase
MAFMQEIFGIYKHDIRQVQLKFIQHSFTDCNQDLRRLYQKYTTLDENYPRPLLTLLGIFCAKDESPVLAECLDPEYLLVPQLVRDVLAIHDDIIDEDITKFGAPTLPVDYGRLFQSGANGMTKEGKDLALLFGDYLYPKVYDIVLNTALLSERKLAIIARINLIMRSTNIGQIDEQMMQQHSILRYSRSDILDMYRRKAADYCYAFPFELGAMYSGVPSDTIARARGTLLKLGAASQAVDDLMGIFPEALGDTKDTLSDLLMLRRSYVLLTLAERADEQTRLALILSQEHCNEAEACFLKEQIRATGALVETVRSILAICTEIKEEVAALSIGTYCKEYFLRLVQARVEENLRRIVAYFEL